MLRNGSISIGIFVGFILALLGGVMVWSASRHVQVRDRNAALLAEEDEAIAPNPQDVELMKRALAKPHPRLVLTDLRCYPIIGGQFKFEFQIQNFGTPSKVISWHATVVQHGVNYRVPLQLTFNEVIGKKPRQGFLIGSVPAWRLLSAHSDRGTTWSVGYSDSLHGWRWAHCKI